jgi:hypothetical protein
VTRATTRMPLTCATRRSSSTTSSKPGLHPGPGRSVPSHRAFCPGRTILCPWSRLSTWRCGRAARSPSR